MEWLSNFLGNSKAFLLSIFMGNCKGKLDLDCTWEHQVFPFLFVLSPNGTCISYGVLGCSH